MSWSNWFAPLNIFFMVVTTDLSMVVTEDTSHAPMLRSNSYALSNIGRHGRDVPPADVLVELRP